MKYKVGDRVRIRQDLSEDEIYGEMRCNPTMIECKGQIATIKNLCARGLGYEIDLDYQAYVWTDEMFEDLAKYTYEDLKKAPIGTKITFENGEILVKDDLAEREEDKSVWTNYDSYNSTIEFKYFKDEAFGKIVKIEEPSYKTVYEVKEILDEKEKEYLSNVIKPFRDIVISIKKVENNHSCEFISIKFKKVGNVFNVDFTCLPDFKEKTMYKGMEIDKEYSLEELGL